MVVKHCCYGLCTSDNRYPNKLLPGPIKGNMNGKNDSKNQKPREQNVGYMHAVENILHQ